jgi:hypothetical protein
LLPEPGPQARNEKLAPDPVIPTMDRIRAWDGSIVELPFVPPPDFKHRKWNYWMMSQRSGNLSYPTFAAGVSLGIYALFLWACDAKGWRLGLFRTLGTNSLAAYILHDVAGWTLPATAKWAAPRISQMGLPESITYPLTHLFDKKCPEVLPPLISFALFTLFVWALCRVLEWRRWYIRV